MTEQEFWQILAAVPQPKPIFYRLYYNDDGSPLCYTMEDLPGQYIEIDCETYHRGSPWVRVVNGTIRRINHTTATKLTKSATGTSCHPNNVAVIDPSSRTTWSKQIYGYESN